MELYFIYINGLNEIDTIHFDSITDRNKYMSTGEVKTVVTDAFYPPHYHLSIRVDSDDIDLNTNANYLSFEYKDKWYYYFIQSIRYVNENILEFSLKMDTIMTYYFDASKYSGIVERNTIKRWNGNNINRDYIPENIANTDTYNHIQTDSLAIGEVFVDLIFQSSDLTNLRIFGQYSSVAEPYVVFFVPRDKKGNFINNISLDTGASIKFTYSAPTGLYNDATTQFVIGNIPLSYLIGANYTTGYIDGNYSLIMTESVISNYINLLLYSDNKPPYLKDYFSHNILVSNSKTISTPFIKNTDATKSKNYKYCPYLINPMYYKISYGGRDNLKVMQADRYNTTSYTLKYICDITTGSMIYGINNIPNDYGEVLYTSSTKYLDIASDPWKQYWSRNKSSFITSLAVDSLKTGLSIKGGSYRGITEGLTSLAVNVANAVDIHNSPVSCDNRGDIVQLLISDSDKVFISQDCVCNIQQCANYFETYGLLVNKQINNMNLNILYNRYYYDYIKFSDVEVSFERIIPLDIQKDYISRLKNGVRFWHYSSEGNIGVYNDDNVEKSW